MIDRGHRNGTRCNGASGGGMDGINQLAGVAPWLRAIPAPMTGTESPT